MVFKLPSIHSFLPVKIKEGASFGICRKTMLCATSSQHGSGMLLSGDKNADTTLVVHLGGGKLNGTSTYSGITIIYYI